MPKSKPKSQCKNCRKQGHRYLVPEVFHLIKLVVSIILDLLR